MVDESRDVQALRQILDVQFDNIKEKIDQQNRDLKERVEQLRDSLKESDKRFADKLDQVEETLSYKTEELMKQNLETSTKLRIIEAKTKTWGAIFGAAAGFVLSLFGSWLSNIFHNN